MPSEPIEFHFGNGRYESDVANIWTAVDERWPDGVERPDAAVTERIIREIADPVACVVAQGGGR